MAAVRVLAGEAGGLERVYCLVVLLCLALAAAALSGRPGFGLFLAGVLGLILRYASDTKVALLHAPLLMPDLRTPSIRRPLSVFLHYGASCAPGWCRPGRMVLALAGAGMARTGGGAWPRGRGGPGAGRGIGRGGAAGRLHPGAARSFARLHALRVWGFCSAPAPIR